MAFLEWRRFSFFDLHKQADGGKIAETLQDTTIAVAISGNSHMVLCDTTGWIHLVSRAWNITSFKAYELTVTLAQQFQHDPFLVTIGDEEAGTNPILKVWDWSRTDRHGNPTCVRVCRAVPSHMKPTPATALAIHDNKNLLAVGFDDGSVSLFRGDVTRQRSSKMRTLADSGTTAITGLAFKGAHQLFVASRASVLVYWLNSSGAERAMAVDAGGGGAAAGCSVLADQQHFMVARNDAIYCYTTDGRGPCYALEGEKKRLDWFRSYLIITTNDYPTISAHKASSSNTTSKSNTITVLDIQNKFIVFTMTFDEIEAVITEWGSFYILTKSKEVLFLDEKDLQSKLLLLFKKNLFDVAIRIASSQQYDADGLTEIYKQYGDHLYAKGDHKGAIEQYIKTIGRLETSYVIRKYLESRHLELLIFYLQELHKKGLATEEHTTLLLTCLVKIDQHDQQGKLKQFINAGDTLHFDVDIAIKVVRQVSPDDALLLAKNNKRHDWYLKIVTEDKKDFRRALSYIADLEFDDADLYMKKYGNMLIQHIPKESTDFLKVLCTDYRPRNKSLVDDAMLAGQSREPDRAHPDQYIHLFLNHSEWLIEFLEHMIAADHKHCSKLLYNALVEHYIHLWSKSPAPSAKIEYEQKVMKVLKNPEANYDKDQTLIICQMLGFKQGILYLYEENKLWHAQVALHLRADDPEGALGVCRRRGKACPQLWLDVLWSGPRPEYLPELLHVIASERLLSPMLVIDTLASTTACTLGDVRKYLSDMLKTEMDVTSREQQLSDKYRAETDKMKQQIHNIQNEPIVFQNSRCAACHQLLELSTVHFLCQHSYHQHCFQSFSSEEESECPACAPTVAAHRAATAAPPAPAEALHARLQAEPDPYSVVSEYFGRGLFNKLSLVTDNGARGVDSGAPVELQPMPSLRLPPPTSIVPPPTYGLGAEAKLRLQEGQSKQVFTSENTKQTVPKGTSIVPIPEGRMRILEQQQNKYSSSLEANINRKHIEAAISSGNLERSSPVISRKKYVKVQQAEPTSLPNSGASSPKLSAFIATQNQAKVGNPFEEEKNYDESKNPFAEEEDPSNPFANEEDYDKNLNPFS